MELEQLKEGIENNSYFWDDCSEDVRDIILEKMFSSKGIETEKLKMYRTKEIDSDFFEGKISNLKKILSDLESDGYDEILFDIEFGSVSFYGYKYEDESDNEYIERITKYFDNEAECYINNEENKKQLDNKIKIIEDELKELKKQRSLIK